MASTKRLRTVDLIKKNRNLQLKYILKDIELVYVDVEAIVFFLT